MVTWRKTRAGPRAVDRAARPVGASAAAGSAAMARVARVHAAPAGPGRAARVGLARAAAHPATVAPAWAADRVAVVELAGRAPVVRPAVRAVQVGLARAAAHPATVAPAWAADRVAVVELAVRAAVELLAAAVHSAGPEPIAAARVVVAALPAARAPAARAPAAGLPMTIVAGTSAQAVPRLPGRALDQAVAGVRPAPLAVPGVAIPAMPVGTESRLTAVASVAVAPRRPAQGRRAGTVAQAG
jgi:hypothetical protein